MVRNPLLERVRVCVNSARGVSRRLHAGNSGEECAARFPAVRTVPS